MAASKEVLKVKKKNTGLKAQLRDDQVSGRQRVEKGPWGSQSPHTAEGSEKSTDQHHPLPLSAVGNRRVPATSQLNNLHID